MTPRFAKTYCSQCGREFGPGDNGYSHCHQHEPTVKRVYIGGGAQMTAPLNLEWHLRYGDPSQVRYVAAEVVASFKYLIEECSRDEAWRRIKLMRESVAHRGGTKCTGP